MSYIVKLCSMLLLAVMCDGITPELPLQPLVETVSGSVLGSIALDGIYYQYLGIPYADSTSGSHRFKAPSPPPHFTEIFVANRKDIKCVRALGNSYEGTEDCLVVNVFTPTLDATKQLPVMVWVKGKEFDQAQQHELSFKHLVEKEVIVVTLNYRESLLGFLCLGTETAPGNAGLKDIIAGLNWVQENIANFGGNPNDVTLFGHGSGAAAVDLVTLSPMGEGLVHRAIAQSGNAFAPWAVSRDNIHYAVKVAEALGHTITDIESLSTVFTRASLPALMAAINELDLTDNSLAFSPCLEKENLKDPFMTKSPFQVISDGEFMQIPFITGFVDNEGTIRSDEVLESDWLQKMEDHFSTFLQSDLEFKSDVEKEEVANEIKFHYFKNEPITIYSINEYLSYHGDTMILVSSIKEARLRATSSSAPVYLYQFSYEGTLGVPFEGPLPVEGAAHSEELPYLFQDISIIPDETEIPELDNTVAKLLIERWTNFAKSGIPSSAISETPWEPFTVENSQYIRFLDGDEINEDSGTLEINLHDPHPEEITFWNSIYEEHFLDARSKWELTIRDDDDDDDNDENGNGDGSGDGDNEEEDDGDDDGSGGGDNVDDEEDEEEEDDGNNASSASGCTFVIISLFAILEKFHSSVIIV